MRGTTSFDVLSVKVRAGVSAVGDWKNPQKRIVNMRTFWVYISRIWGDETPGRIESKFCLDIETQDVITCVKFGDDRLRGFWLAGGQSSPFPIDFAGRPYNSATLSRAL